MYNFSFSTTKLNNLKDEINFLLTIKSLLPRYLNSIPDSEFICICNLLDIRGSIIKENKTKKPVFVETGCGASSLAFTYFAFKHNGIAYTWDANPLKISEIRRVLNETISLKFNLNLNEIWKPIQHLSNSRTVGIHILEELDKKVDLFMHDSEHTQKTLISELDLIINNSSEDFDCLIDDAHYKFINYDYAYANLMRAKLNLEKKEIPQKEIGLSLKDIAIQIFKKKNLSFHDLQETNIKTLSNYKTSNHLEKFNSIVNVTGNQDNKSSFSLERFAAFRLNKNKKS